MPAINVPPDLALRRRVAHELANVLTVLWHLPPIADPELADTVSFTCQKLERALRDLCPPPPGAVPDG